MEALYEVKFERCFKTFEKLLKEQHINEPTN